MSENKRIEGSMQVKVSGTVVWVGIDTAHPLGRPTSSGKSTIVARTLGLVPVEVGGRKFGVMGGLYEAVGKEAAYEAQVAKAAATMVAKGMDPAVAEATAREIIEKPKEPKEKKAATAAEATTAAKSLAQNGVGTVALSVARGKKGKPAADAPAPSAPAPAPACLPPNAPAGDTIPLSGLSDTV